MTLEMDCPSRCAELERKIADHEAKIMLLQKSLADISAKFSWINSQCELAHFEPFPKTASAAVSPSSSLPTLVTMSPCTSPSDVDAFMSPDWVVYQPSKRAATDMKPAQRKLF